MIVKKLFVFKRVILCATFLIIFTNFSIAQDKNQVGSTNEYSSAKYGISFHIPNGIKLYTTKNPGPLTSQISEKEPFIFVNPNYTEENINVQVAPNISEGDLSGYKKLLDENPKMPLPKYKRISVNTIKIGKHKNKTAIEHVFIMQGNILGKLRQITFVHRERGFTFTCATAIDRFDKANEDFFQPIFNSMEFK